MLLGRERGDRRFINKLSIVCILVANLAMTVATGINRITNFVQALKCCF